MEKRIIIELDENGKITAETEGVTGEVCLEKLDEILNDIDEIQDVEKMDEYYMDNNMLPKIKKQNIQKLK